MANAERRRELFLQGFERLASLGYELTVQNPQYFDILRKEPQNPAIVYFNHTTQDDPVLAVTLLQKYLPERLMNVVMPISEYHAQFRKFKRYWAMTNIGKTFAGFSMPKIVQSYRRRREAGEPYDQKKALALDLQFMHLLKERLPTGCLAIISPEGHRSDTGTLLPAEEGAGAIALLMMRLKDRGELENGYFLPLGIVMEDFRGSDLHYNLKQKARLTITVGKPLDVEAVVTDESTGSHRGDVSRISHFLMETLTEILPERMHGVYEQSLRSDTYAGRFELRMQDSDVIVYDATTSGKFEQRR